MKNRVAGTAMLLTCILPTLVACDPLSIVAQLLALNSVVDDSPYTTYADRALHGSLPFVADTHADTANFLPANETEYTKLLGEKIEGTNRRRANEEGHVDLVRLVEGNVALQVFAVITEGSADHIIGDEFETELGDGSTDRFVYEMWQRNPSNPHFAGPSDITPYTKKFYYLGAPRPPTQYAMYALGYDCEYWFTKRVDAEWEGAPWVSDWPSYAHDKLDEVEPEQRCYAAETDPDHDVHMQWMLRFAQNMEDASILTQSEQNRLRIIRSLQDLLDLEADRATDKHLVGALLATEGIYVIDVLGRPDTVQKTDQIFDALYNAGYRMFSLTHFPDSEFGGSSTGAGDLSVDVPFGPFDPENPDSDQWDGVARGRKLGISPAGRRMAERMIGSGVVIDVAHASPGLS